MNIKMSYLVLSLLICVAAGIDNQYGEQLQHYETIIPKLHQPTYNSNKSAQFADWQGSHLKSLNIEFYAYGKFFLLNLEQHYDFHPNTVAYYSVEKNGDVVTMNDFENCYYNGKIVGEKDSIVSMVTCDGLSGTIVDGNGESFVVENIVKERSWKEHIIYKLKDIVVNETFSCAQNDEHEDIFQESISTMQGFSLHRQRRSTVKTYIELVLVSDAAVAKANGGKEGARKRLLEILTNVKTVYKTINSDVVLIGLIAFESNPFTVSTSASVTLGEFSSYFNSNIRNNAKYGNLDPDSAHLISGIRFDKNQVGLADVGSVCNKARAAGVTSDKRSVINVANTLAHEIGHNIGFVHVSHKDCEDCVMRDIAPWKPVKYFASLNSVDRWSKKLNAGRFRCLWNKPSKVYEPRCGDGIRQKNEECDCGSTAECELSGEDACCDMKTCKLKDSAECSDGPCCSNCKFTHPGVLCRGPFDIECEVNEYCKGNSSECPPNSFVQNGTPCGNSKICVQGSCVTWRKYTSSANCKLKCQNGGVCNNHGNCHCPPGYACPDCSLLGMGGSLNSGQGCIDPTVCSDGCLSLAVKIVVIVLFTLPILVFIAFVIFKHRKTMVVQWKAFIKDVKAGWKNRQTTSRTRNPVNATRNPEVGYRQPNKPKYIAKPTTVHKDQHVKKYVNDSQQQHSTPSAKPQAKPGNLREQIKAYNNMNAKAAGKR